MPGRPSGRRRGSEDVDPDGWPKNPATWPSAERAIRSTKTPPTSSRSHTYEVGGVTAPAERAEHDIFLANRGQLDHSTLPTAPLRKPSPSTRQPPRQLPDNPAALLSVAHEA
jgi:hypothetical protein